MTRIFRLNGKHQETIHVICQRQSRDDDSYSLSIGHGLKSFGTIIDLENMLKEHLSSPSVSLFHVDGIIQMNNCKDI